MRNKFEHDPIHIPDLKFNPQFPEAPHIKAAADEFERGRIAMDAAIPQGYKIKIMLQLSLSTLRLRGVEKPSLSLLCDAFGIPVDAARNALTYYHTILPEDLVECESILATVQEQERKQKEEQEEEETEQNQRLHQAKEDILSSLSQRPAILEDETTIFSRIQAREQERAVPGKTGQKPGQPNHVRRLSIVRRLRTQGKKHKEIVEMSDLRNIGIVDALTSELIELGLDTPRPLGPAGPTPETMQLITLITRERARNPKIAYKELIKIASAELGRDISIANIRRSVEKSPLVKRKIAPIEETYGLIALYEEEHEKKHPEKELDKKDLADFLKLGIEWVKILYRSYKNKSSASRISALNLNP